MTRHDRSPWPRCLTVWLLATGCLALLLPWLLGGVGSPRGFEAALVDSMSAAAAASALWLWLIASMTALDAARGREHRRRAGVPDGVRRMVLAACGVAVATGGLAVPAHAEDGHHDATVLTGLPLPDRPTTLSTLGLAFEVAQATAPATHAEHGPPAQVARTVVVRPGDTLWSIAAQHVPHPDNDAIGRACAHLYQLNRAVIGDDPDLIRPGQRLQLPHLSQEES